MFVQVRSAVLSGPTVLPVTVEVESTHRGLPNISLIGLAHGAVLESKERVFSALRCSGVNLPRSRTTMSLVPVDVPKRGSSLDVALAIGLLLIHQLIPAGEYAAVGELGLDGTLHDCAGLLGLADTLRTSSSLFVPGESVRRLAPLAPAAAIYPVACLADLIAHLHQQSCLLPLDARYWPLAVRPSATPAVAVSASVEAPIWKTAAPLLRVLSLAAAGGHHTLLFGSPGVGKTFAKNFLQALLPPETNIEKYQRAVQLDIQTTEGWSSTTRRLIDPHHSITLAGLIGGGSPLHAGAISAAHQNWLFLDELPEFRRECLEALRQPLEAESLTLARAQNVWHLPCSFTMVATANPCPCGWYGTRQCRCRYGEVQRYLQRISGPILDRIDVQWRVTDRNLREFTVDDQRKWQERVEQARQRQRWRAQHWSWPTWARQYQWDHWRQQAKRLQLTKNDRAATTATRTDHTAQSPAAIPWQWFIGWSRRRQLIAWRVAQTLADLDEQDAPTQAQWSEARHLVGASFLD
jgi:magnesium chelatase family protein